MSKLLSIIIPVYNNSKYLQRCFESVLELDSNDVEIIIIDDGSTDGSSKICDFYAVQNNHIIVKHIENGGVSRARNIGVGLATGEYITFLDSDDYMNFEEVNKVLKVIRKKAYDTFICNYSYINMNGAILYNSENTTGEFTNEKVCCKIIFGRLRCSVGSVIVRLQISKLILFNEQCKYGEDIEYIYKCLMNSKSIIVLENYIYNYINNSGSAMNSVTVDRFDVVFARKRFYDYVCSNFSQCKELEDKLIKYNIPEAIAHILTNLSYDGIKYKLLLSYMNEKGINSMIDCLLPLNIDSEFKHVFQEWKKSSFKFYLRRRLKCLKDTIKHNIYILIRRKKWMI